MYMSNRDIGEREGGKAEGKRRWIAQGEQMKDEEDVER